MVELKRVGIGGLGSYSPEKVLSNFDLEKMVDTSDDWIFQRTGIRERRIAAEDEDSGKMGAIAAERALQDAGVDPSEVDLIICATTTPDMMFPSTACHIQEAIGAWNAGGFDLNSACSGFVFGVNTAAQFVATGRYRNVLIIGTEKLSSIINYRDRSTCVLFGDGAGAMLLRPLEDARLGEYLTGRICIEGGNDDTLILPAGGSRIPASFDTVEKKMHYLVMGGNKVYRFAVITFAKLVEETLAKYGAEEFGRIVPHQVNQRIVEAAVDRLGIDPGLIFSNIHKYGNTAAASVPVALDEAYREGVLPKGKIIICPAFGAGLSWGQFIIRW